MYSKALLFLTITFFLKSKPIFSNNFKDFFLFSLMDDRIHLILGNLFFRFFIDSSKNEIPKPSPLNDFFILILMVAESPSKSNRTCPAKSPWMEITRNKLSEFV